MYCDNGYELYLLEDDSRMCFRETIKSLRDYGIYTCEDSEHYNYDEETRSCVIKPEYSTEMIKKKKCRYGSGHSNTRTELVDVDESCKSAIYEQGVYFEKEFVFMDSYEVDTCPNGYYLIDKMCINNTITYTTIERVCPEGYKLYRGYRKLGSTKTYPFENPQCVKIEEKKPKSRWSF